MRAPVYESVHVQYLLQRRKMFPSSSSSSSYSLSFSLFLRGFSLLVFPENFTKREAGQMSVRLLPFSVGQCCADSSFPFPYPRSFKVNGFFFFLKFHSSLTGFQRHQQKSWTLAILHQCPPPVPKKKNKQLILLPF